MIVNSAMLTVKTDEIGAAIWSQKAQQQNAFDIFLVENMLLICLHVTYMFIEVSYLGLCLPLPVSGSVSEP